MLAGKNVVIYYFWKSTKINRVFFTILYKIILFPFPRNCLIFVFVDIDNVLCICYNIEKSSHPLSFSRVFFLRNICFIKFFLSQYNFSLREKMWMFLFLTIVLCIIFCTFTTHSFLQFPLVTSLQKKWQLSLKLYLF